MDIKQKLVSKYTSFVKNTQKTEHYNYINEQYCSTIEQILLNEEQLQWLDTSQRKELLDCLLHLFDSNYESSRYTGIAIAGFGDSEVFPHMVHIHIEGIINGKVRYKLIEMVEISEQNKSAIIPLAQTDVIQTFLFGSSDQLLNELANRMSNYISENINAIDESLFAPGKRNDVSNVICNLSKMHDCIYSFIHDKYLYPIISSIAGLPVEELSLLAESLINITSIKRKFTIDQNIGTVGGPIDVSIITRGDGFIWRKRKHYFEPKYNPQFFSSHYNYNIVEHALNDDI